MSSMRILLTVGLAATMLFGTDAACASTPAASTAWPGSASPMFISTLGTSFNDCAATSAVSPKCHPADVTPLCHPADVETIDANCNAQNGNGASACIAVSATPGNGGVSCVHRAASSRVETDDANCNAENGNGASACIAVSATADNGGASCVHRAAVAQGFQTATSGCTIVVAAQAYCARSCIRGTRPVSGTSAGALGTQTLLKIQPATGVPTKVDVLCHPPGSEGTSDASCNSVSTEGPCLAKSALTENGGGTCVFRKAGQRFAKTSGTPGTATLGECDGGLAATLGYCITGAPDAGYYAAGPCVLGKFGDGTTSLKSGNIVIQGKSGQLPCAAPCAGKISTGCVAGIFGTDGISVSGATAPTITGECTTDDPTKAPTEPSTSASAMTSVSLVAFGVAAMAALQTI